MPLVAFDKPIQTRSEENGLRQFDTVQEALNHAEEDGTVWKISFKLGNERLRLTRNVDRLGPDKGDVMIGPWVLEGTQGAINEATQKFIDMKDKEIAALSKEYHAHADEGRNR